MGLTPKHTTSNPATKPTSGTATTDDQIADEQRRAFLKVLDAVTAAPAGLAFADVADMVMARWRAHFQEHGGDDPDVFRVSTLVRTNDNQALINLVWGPQNGILTVPEAQEKALAMLGACEGSLTDAAILRMFADKGEEGKQMAAYLMFSIAQARGQQAIAIDDPEETN